MSNVTTAFERSECPQSVCRRLGTGVEMVFTMTDPSGDSFFPPLLKSKGIQSMRSLESTEYGEIWDAFYETFKFRPSVNGPFPAIVEPLHSITFRLRDQYKDSELDELRDVIFHAFSIAIGPLDEIYYLDWQHECFGIKIDVPSFTVNGYPDGDYAIFLGKNMQCGTFGHPWEGSICFFGDVFVNEILKKRPSILGGAIRNEGGYAL